MATAYSDWLATDDWRTVLEVWTEDLSQTVTRIHATCRIQSQYARSTNAQGSVSVGGQQLASADGVQLGEWSTATVCSGYRDMRRGASSYDVSVSAWGYLSYTGGATAALSVTIPQRGYSAPRPPASPSVRRVSDTSQALSWEADYTGLDGERPWTGIYVDRRTDGGPWVNIAKLPWSATNYADNGTSADHLYEYRLCAWSRTDSSGYLESDHVAAGTVRTTPAAPASVTLSKSSAGSVTVSISGASRVATAYEVEARSNGGPWEPAGSFPSLPREVPAAAGTVVVRVRASGGGLSSAWAESAPLVTICAPLAPTLVGMRGAYPAGEPVVVSWERSHPDGTAQTAAQVEVETGGSVSVREAGTAPSLALGLPLGTHRVRVRTKGLHAGWGAWSGRAVVVVAVPPQCFVSSPATDGEVVGSAPVPVEVSVTDATGVASATLSLLDASGVTISTEDVTGRDRATVGGYATLANDTPYSLVLSVRGGSGLSATSTRSFVTGWDLPAMPSADVTQDASLACHVRVVGGDSAYSVDGTALTGPMVMGSEVLLYGTMRADGGALVVGDAARCSSCTVERECDGEVAVIAAGLLDGQEAIDRLPPLNAPFRYLVTGRSEAGTSSQAVVGATVRSGGMALNFGQDASRVLIVGLNAGYSTSSERPSESFHLARGGTSMPVAYPLDQLDTSTSLSFEMRAGLHSEFRRVMREEWRGWWRGHAGERGCGPMTFSESFKAPGVWEGSVRLTHEDFEEPSNG